MKTAEDSKSLTARSRSLSETQKELVSYAQKLDGVREVNKSDVVAKMLSSVNTEETDSKSMRIKKVRSDRICGKRAKRCSPDRIFIFRWS